MLFYFYIYSLLGNFVCVCYNKNMKVVTYNLNGIRASTKLGLLDWLKEYDADVYCFQEVRASEEVTKNLLFGDGKQLDLFSLGAEENKLDKYFPVYNCGGVAGYAGTMILSKQKPDVVLLDMGEFWTDNEGRTTTVIFGSTAILDAYIPNGNSRLEFKMKYLDALTRFIIKLKEKYSVICVGDFNIAHNEIDLTNPRECQNKSVFLPIERKAFQRIVDCGMVDTFRFLNPEKVEYSWRSYRSRFDTSYNSWKYRIDYVLASEDLKSTIKKAEVLEEPYSDHLPCVAEFKL